MKLFRVAQRGWAVEVAGALHELATPWLQLGSGEPVLGAAIDGDVAFEAPVAPTKIICVGLNFAAHAAEQNKAIPPEPLLFMKPLTALSNPGGTIVLPKQSDEVHFEGELAVVIGARLRDASPSDARAGIFGYTCANDVTARDIQRREGRYTRAKGYDTFCPIGPCVVPASEFAPCDAILETRVNGVVRQHSRLDDFIFAIDEVVSFVSEIMTLLPGDVILTGTPSGVGALRSGDEVAVEVSGIGVLRSVVI